MTDIFSFMYDQYHLPTKPKLFEAFSGVGCQRMAFDRLGINYEMVGISEIDKYALQSYMAIHGYTKNYGSICDIKGKDLPQIDVFTYSFPCTDLSKAGKQKGLSDTRSGLVYEVLRILQELNVEGRLPNVLIMENVVDLVQTKFIRQFQEIQLELEQLGYTNYTQTLNAKNYGVAQNRDRVFMVSILGEYSYEFPNPFILDKKLRDYLENSVNEKYYLSDKALNGLVSTQFNCSSLEARTEKDGVIPTLCARDYKDPKLVVEGKHYIKDFDSITKINESYSQLNGGKWEKMHDIGRRVYNADSVSPTIHTMGGGNLEPKIVEPVICASRGRNPINPKSRESGLPTEQMIEVNDSGLSNTLTTVQKDNMVLEQSLRIRKLTPLECWRLMGISDDQFHKAEKVCSNSQLYKQAGNGIVVDVFMAIIKNLI